MRKSYPVFLLVCCFPFLAGCASSGLSLLENRLTLANTIAGTAMPAQQLIHAGDFNLASRARITNPDRPARVYIEGDGLAWKNKYTPSDNPTPTNPVALRLASVDPSPNVIWLARPCQYEGFSAECSREYWTNKRFAPEVIASYQSVLDTIKSQYQIKQFELIGFSGGAAIAVILAAERNDIVNIRTVAGNLNHVLLHQIHHVSQIPESLNPKDFAQHVSNLPQIHFIGTKDKIVLLDVYESFISAMADHSCTEKKSADASHTEGWEHIWPELLKQQPSCR